MKKLYPLILLFLCFSHTIVLAQNSFNLDNLQKPKISSINVEGLNIVKKTDFLSQLPIKKGDDFSQPKMLDSIRFILGSGSFLDASVAYQEEANNNIAIFYTVVERTWIEKLEFKGNDDVSDSTLKGKISTEESSFLNENTLKKDIETILNQYMMEGYVGTQVDLIKEKTKSKKIKIIFQIAEGSKLTVKNINVYGTQILSPLYLKSGFATLKEPFLFNLMKYPLIPQALEYEKTRIVQLAHDKGFMDFSVIRTEINAYFSYNPTLEYMKKKLRRFKFSNAQIKQYQNQFKTAFQKKDINQIDNIISQLRGETKNNQKLSHLFTDIDLFLKNLEVSSQALLDLEPLLAKNFPTQTKLNTFFTDSSTSYYEINFHINEGNAYLFLGVNITGSSRVNPENLKVDFLTLYPGSTYNETAIKNFQQSIVQYFRDQGYFGVVIKDNLVKDANKQTIRHELIVQEGQKMHIHKMYIDGNVKTKNMVVDRELRIREGDIFNQSSIATSQRLLQRTGYFEAIDIIPSAGPEENLLDLTWQLKEQKTGKLQLGGGYGTETGFSLFSSISENNFLGYGVNAAGKLSFGQYERGLQFSFSSNYINYLPVGWSISSGYTWVRQQTSPRYDRDGDGVWDKVVQKDDGKYYLIKQGDEDFGSYFDENRTGNFTIKPETVNPDGSLNFVPSEYDDLYSTERYFDKQVLFLDLGTGYSFANFWTFNILHSSLFSKYQNPKNINIDNLLETDYYSLKDDLISNNWSYTSHIDLSMIFNNTNNYYSPTEGINTRLTLAFYGIEGGYDNFFRVSGSFAGYIPLLTLIDQDFKLVWANGIRISSITPLFGPLKLHYENQLGFNTMEEVRGWSNYVDDSDLLGLGKISFGSEIRASIPYTNSMLWFVLFFDGGNISDKVSSLPTDFSKYLYSTGVGIRLDFPSFPIRFYLAQRLKWDKYFFTRTGGINFEFSVSSAF